MTAQGVEELAAASASLRAEGKSCVWVAVQAGEGMRADAVLVMADPIRDEAKQLTAALHARGLKKVVMLTGDHMDVAQSVAKEVGIDEVHAGLLPEDKLEIIRSLKAEGHVMMVGDGVNDAPALALSDLGLAMGAAGTDVAMETADIVLMGDRLENIPVLLQHARRARRILIQNLTFAGGVILVLVAATLGLSLKLPMGVIGHEGSTILVCLNGLRLLMVKTSVKPD